LAPRVRDPEPHYDDLVGEVAAFLVDRAERALAAGLAADQIVLDAGLDLGKTAAQSAVLLRESERLAALGYPLLLSASNKTFLGVLLDLAVDARRAPSLAAVAYGVAHGCRIVRVHDVAGTVRIVRVVDRPLSPASTPPFGTERRVIVIREVGSMSVADADAVARYLADPCPSTALVLVGGGGRLPVALTKAVKAAGGQEIKTAPGKTGDALAGALDGAGITLTA